MEDLPSTYHYIEDQNLTQKGLVLQFVKSRHYCQCMCTIDAELVGFGHLVLGWHSVSMFDEICSLSGHLNVICFNKSFWIFAYICYASYNQSCYKFLESSGTCVGAVSNI